MYRIDWGGGTDEPVLLRDAQDRSRVELAPFRGGMCTRFRVGDREVLYLDRASFDDRSKNVRGGIPVLFPIAGKLKGEQYTRDGVTRPMRQHGFARNLPWAVERVSATPSQANVTLILASNDATRAAFPWDFEVRITYVLAGATLTLDQEYRNTSASPMPLHAGFHPYFAVAQGDKATAEITTDATRAYDNRTGQEVPFTGFDLTRDELDLHLLDNTARAVHLRAGGRSLRIDMDEAFGTLVVWTLAGKDFVCVEPWTAPGDAMNTGAGLRYVAPDETLRARFSITAE